jgi:chaperonin cofactor prefoldin
MAQQLGGMFGPTPEELQYALAQQQGDQDWKEANAWGGKGLAQQISTGAFAGGMGIGRGLQSLGQATGYLPQDPRIAEAQRLMEVKKSLMEANLDPQDIDTYYPEMIKRLNAAGFSDQANKAMAQYQGLSNQQDAIQVRKDAAAAKKREEAMPGYKFIQPLIKGLEKNPENARIVNKFVQSVTPQNPTGDLDLLAELESKAAGVKVKHVGEDGPTGLPAYQNEDGSDAAWYRDPKTGQKVTITSGLRDRAAKVSVGGSTLSLPTKATDLVNDFNKGQERYAIVFDSAQKAKQLINEAKNSNNSQTWEAARTTIARAVGESKLSNEDIRRTGIDPRLVQGALDWVSKKTVGVPNEDIMKQLYVLSSILERDAKMRGDRYVDQVRAATRKENPDFKDIEQLFPYMGVNPSAPPSAAGTPTLRWDGKQLVPVGK